MRLFSKTHYGEIEFGRSVIDLKVHERIIKTLERTDLTEEERTEYEQALEKFEELHRA